MLKILYKNFVNFIILFFVINIISLVVLFFMMKKTEIDNIIDEISFLANSNVKDFNELNLNNTKISNPPMRTPHPYLIMSQGVSTKDYTMGIEGIRYHDNWDDVLVQKKLYEKPIFVFGGSTTFGDGVKNNETFSFFLNQFDPKNSYLNFGVQGYDNIHEVRKLIYLLLKGYRPKKVIFFDGLNEVQNLLDSRLDYYIDQNRNKSYLCGGTWNKSKDGSPGYPTKNGMVKSFINALPIYHLVVRTFGTKKVFDKTYDYIDPNYQIWDPCDKWNESSESVVKKNFYKFKQYINESNNLLRALAIEYKFDYKIFFQPLGPIQKNNIYVGETAIKMQNIDKSKKITEESVIKKFEVFNHLVTNSIKKDEIPMFDLSSCFETKENESENFVDATHYSKSGNEKIAKCILKDL